MAHRASASVAKKKNILGPVLRVLREKHGLMQTELCAKLQRRGWDIAPTLYSQIENSKRSITDIEIEMILKCLGETWVCLDEIRANSVEKKRARS